MVARLDRIAAGTILASTWGWDQTNVEFYLVTKRTPKTVVLVRLPSRFVEEDQEMMTYRAVPEEQPKADTAPMRRKVHAHLGSRGEFVATRDHSFAHVWDGEPVPGSYYG